MFQGEKFLFKISLHIVGKEPAQHSLSDWWCINQEGD